MGASARVEPRPPEWTAAFETLFSRDHDLIFSIVVGVLRCREDAEEIVVDVYVALSRMLDGCGGGFRLPVSLSAAAGNPRSASRRRVRNWLCSTARNSALSRIRCHSSGTTVELCCDFDDDMAPSAYVAPGPSPIDDVIAEEERVQINAALNAMEPETRRACRLQLELHSIRLVAAEMAVSIKVVRRLLREARIVLRALLWSPGPSLPGSEGEHVTQGHKRRRRPAHRGAAVPATVHRPPDRSQPSIRPPIRPSIRPSIRVSNRPSNQPSIIHLQDSGVRVLRSPP